MPDNVLFQLGGDTYKLVEFHFCAPSEHSIDGEHAAIEAQLVHRHVQTGNIVLLHCVSDLVVEGAYWPKAAAALAVLSSRASPAPSRQHDGAHGYEMHQDHCCCAVYAAPLASHFGGGSALDLPCAAAFLLLLVQASCACCR
jgi:hypothetical protein